MPTVVLNGRSYDLATLIANAGYGYVAKDDRGYNLWPDAIFFDMLAELSYVKAAGATSASNITIGAGAKSLTLDAAATLPAGLYMIYKASEAANPVNYFFGLLEAGIDASTAFDVTVPAGSYGGSGSHTGWIIAPVQGRRDPQRNVSGNDNHAITDHRATIRYTGSGNHTQTLLSATTAGVGFTSTFKNVGTTVWTVGTTIKLAPGEAVTLVSNGTTWESNAGVGYGAALRVWPAIITGDFTVYPGFIYRVNTTSQVITGSVAADAPEGAMFGIQDYAGTFGDNTCTVDADSVAGDTIGDTADPEFDFDVDNRGAVFIRDAANDHWGIAWAA